MNILNEVHKYDQEKILQEYKLDLWSLVYLLIKKGNLGYSESIFSLKKKYELEYHNNKIEKQADSESKMEEGIRRDLISKGLIIKNDNIVGITEKGSKIIEEIEIMVSGSIYNKIELCLKKHPIVYLVSGAILTAIITIVLEKLLCVIYNIISYFE